MGYVEDAFEARTTRANFFSILRVSLNNDVLGKVEKRT